MDKYESIEVVGEGSYGVVVKCRHVETGQIVAIKRFLETEEDPQVRKMAFREIRTLKKLRHENLVNMIEVFRRRKRFYLVFEYLDHTLLDEMERAKEGLGWDTSRRHIFQVLRGLNFCHSNRIMHRDVKPENILVSPNGVIKLCDFGFARLVSGPNESCTDYVATRWYRAPELLVGDPRYGRPVDVWAVGCLYAEMINGEPLFPGSSDIDQLHRITKVFGALCGKHRTILARTGQPRSLRLASVDELTGPPRSGHAAIRGLFPSWSPLPVDFLAQCLRTDPDIRPTCSVLLRHPIFTRDSFADRFLPELQKAVAKDSALDTLTEKRIEDTLSPLSAEPSTRMCRSGTGRWKMTLAKNGPVIDVPQEKRIEIESIRELQRPSPTKVARPREICYFGPVSIVPNTTYVKRLERKGILVPESRQCALPSLTSRDPVCGRSNGKRKRIDLPTVDR